MSALCRVLSGLLAATVAAGVGAATDGAACAVAAANLFPAQSWQPPPAPPPAKRVEAPKAPPLPFAYLGQMEEDQGIALFLAHGQRTLVVRAGDSIDGGYRVDSITPMRATFRYLPLDEPQHLTLRTRP